MWGALAIVFGWLLYMGIAPSGRISYVFDFKGEDENYFIKKLTPAERVKAFQNGSQEIIGNPVYFALRTARRFNKAALTLKYRQKEDKSPIGGLSSSAGLPIIEAGILVDKKIWRYDLKPIENKMIDELSKKWDAIKEGGVILLQREKKFESIDDFLDNMPLRQGMALYNYPLRHNPPAGGEESELKDKFILPDYQPKAVKNKVGYALRGPWQIYTYIKNEDLDFSFDFVDLNKNKDADSIDLNLYFNNQLIDSRRIDDDGILTDNGEKTERGELRQKLASLPEGVYKIELKVNDDIITKEIIAKQQKLSFVNKIWLSDARRNDITLFTDSTAISAQTINPGRLQTIKVGERDLKLAETYRQFEVKSPGAISEIKLEKDDIILAGNGVFSFNKDSLINPEFKKVDESFDADKQGVNYILAEYEKPIEVDGWKMASAEFDLTGAYRELFYPRQLSGAGKYNFIISIPGLKAEDDIEDSVEIKEIRVDLEGTSLWEKLRKIVSSFLFLIRRGLR